MERPQFSWELAREAWPALLEGLKITVELTFIVIAISLVLGIFVALGRLSKNRLLSTVVGFYVDFMRATPLLLQLIYIYFVLPTVGIRLEPFTAAVLGLSLNYSAYLSEVYRSGIQAIPRGQLDAAAALGMKPSLTMRRIVLPQAIRIVIPTLGNYFVALFKDTSLASFLTLQELLFSGQIIISRTYDYFTIYTMVIFMYFLVGYPSLIAVRYLEKRTRNGYGRRRTVSALAPAQPSSESEIDDPTG